MTTRNRASAFNGYGSAAAVIIAATLLVAACASGGGPESSSTPAPARSVTAATPVATNSSAPSVLAANHLTARCSDSAPCVLTAGTWVTFGDSAFIPGMAVTVPDGWSSPTASVGELKLIQSDHPDDAIFLWKDVAAIESNGETPKVLSGVPRTPEGLTASFRKNPDFIVSAPTDTTIGGAIPALTYVLGISPSAAYTGRGCPSYPTCANILKDPAHSGPGDFYGIGAPGVVRLYLATVGVASDSHMLVIGLDATDPVELERLTIAAAPIIASISLPAVIGGESQSPVPAGRIAFGRWDPTVGDFVIFSVATNGSDLRQVLPGGHEIPRWSPNGDRLAVAGGNGVRAFETVVEADGSRPQVLQLKDASLSLGCAAWSPDAARLACEGWDDSKPERNGIYTVRSSDGGDLKRVTTSPDGGHDIPGGYSPDGGSIVYSRQRHPDVEEAEVWTVGVDGKAPHRVGAGQFGLGVSLSPDGTSILADAKGILRIIDVESGTEMPIPIAGGAAFGGRWSPDGMWIVFSLVPVGGDDAGVAIARRDGTSVTAVTTPEAGHREEFPDWSVSP